MYLNIIFKNKGTNGNKAKNFLMTVLRILTIAIFYIKNLNIHAADNLHYL
jgi:hypothetical protein